MFAETEVIPLEVVSCCVVDDPVLIWLVSLTLDSVALDVVDEDAALVKVPLLAVDAEPVVEEIDCVSVTVLLELWLPVIDVVPPVEVDCDAAVELIGTELLSLDVT